MDIIPPKLDFVFHLIFGDQRNADILADFLQSILDIPPEDYDTLTIIDPNVKREYRNDKAGVLDVKIKTKSGTAIDVEIQVAPIVPLCERILFYTSKMVTEQIGKGDEYDRIKRVICIVITDFVFLKETDDYHHQYRLYDAKRKSELTDLLEVNILELPKLPDKPEEDGEKRLWNWLCFLRSKSEEELTMLAETSIPMRKAIGILKEISEDERARLVYEQEEKWRMDYAVTMRYERSQGLSEGKAEGLSEGKTEGSRETQLETARRMKAKGFTAADIADITGLPIEYINRLD